MKLSSLAETRAWAMSLVRDLERPCVVLLDGELGAGKTQTVRYVLEALGAVDVASPTFAIHHEYRTPSGPVDHVDLYRVKSDEDLEATGFWDLFARPHGLVFVEWASRLPEDVWPKDWLQVHIQIRKSAEGEEAREVDIRFTRPTPKKATYH